MGFANNEEISIKRRHGTVITNLRDFLLILNMVEAYSKISILLKIIGKNDIFHISGPNRSGR